MFYERAITALLATTVHFMFISPPEVIGEELGSTIGSVERIDASLDKLVAQDATLEVVGNGFEWCEGPVWVSQGGYLLFSDIPRNAVMRWDEENGCTLFLKPAGYTGATARGGESGSNGLAISPGGGLILCQHGDRRLAMLEDLNEPASPFVTLAYKYRGKRFNSPNDVVVHSSGALYFTDPPYGLQMGMHDPTKDLPFQGVFRVARDGDVTLLTKELERPNGIALSPDERTLYVANSHAPRPIIMAYTLDDDGSIENAKVFFDTSPLAAAAEGLCDGMAVDEQGNLFATGPGGVLILAPDGTHLGTLHTGKRTSNCTFGEDGAVLFITADDCLLRVRLRTKGIGF